MTDQPPSDTMIELLKVSKTYPPDIHALVDISLSIPSGAMIFLTGASGAGKTTLLRLLSRIEQPTRGVVEVAGKDLGTLSLREIQRLRQQIGVAYQDFKLLPDQTVARNIGMAMEVAYKTGSTIRDKISELLEYLDLKTKINTPAGDLSRGEQQRIAIARALANDPQLILADEPTGNLDAEASARVMDLFRLYNSRGATVVIATHDQTLLTGTEHRVFELRCGRLLRGLPPTAPVQ